MNDDNNVSNARLYISRYFSVDKAAQPRSSSISRTLASYSSNICQAYYAGLCFRRILRCASSIVPARTEELYLPQVHSSSLSACVHHMDGITFVTGNAKKLAEVNHILGKQITLLSRSIDCTKMRHRQSTLIR